MTFDFSHLMETEEELDVLLEQMGQQIHQKMEQYRTMMHFDDRIHPDYMLYLENRSKEEQNATTITMNYEDKKLKKASIKCNIQYYLYCRAWKRNKEGKIMNYNKKDPIRYLYFLPKFQDMIQASDLPDGVTHLYVSKDYCHRSMLSTLSSKIRVQFYEEMEEIEPVLEK